MAYITVYSDAGGKPYVQGIVSHIEDTEQSSFVILAKAVVGAQGFDRYRLELSKIAKIEGEHTKSNNATMLSFNTMSNSFPVLTVIRLKKHGTTFSNLTQPNLTLHNLTHPNTTKPNITLNRYKIANFTFKLKYGKNTLNFLQCEY